MGQVGWNEAGNGKGLHREGETAEVRRPGEVRIVGDKGRSSFSSSEYYAAESNRRDWEEVWRTRNSFEDALARDIAALNRQKEAWRLYEAQRYGSGGVKLDPVLRSHLGIE